MPARTRANRRGEAPVTVQEDPEKLLRRPRRPRVAAPVAAQPVSGPASMAPAQPAIVSQQAAPAAIIQSTPTPAPAPIAQPATPANPIVTASGLEATSINENVTPALLSIPQQSRKRSREDDDDEEASAAAVSKRARIGDSNGSVNESAITPAPPAEQQGTKRGRNEVDDDEQRDAADRTKRAKIDVRDRSADESAANRARETSPDDAEMIAGLQAALDQDGREAQNEGIFQIQRPRIVQAPPRRDETPEEERMWRDSLYPINGATTTVHVSNNDGQHWTRDPTDTGASYIEEPADAEPVQREVPSFAARDEERVIRDDEEIVPRSVHRQTDNDILRALRGNNDSLDEEEQEAEKEEVEAEEQGQKGPEKDKDDEEDKESDDNESEKASPVAKNPLAAIRSEARAARTSNLNQNSAFHSLQLQRASLSSSRPPPRPSTAVQVHQNHGLILPGPATPKLSEARQENDDEDDMASLFGEDSDHDLDDLFNPDDSEQFRSDPVENGGQPARGGEVPATDRSSDRPIPILTFTDPDGDEDLTAAENILDAPENSEVQQGGDQTGYSSPPRPPTLGFTGVPDDIWESTDPRSEEEESHSLGSSSLELPESPSSIEVARK